MADPHLFDELEIFHTVLDIERDVDGAPFTYGEAGLQKLAATYVARARRRLEERLEDERRNERMTQAYDDAGRPGEGEYDRDDYQEEASDEARAAEADLP